MKTLALLRHHRLHMKTLALLRHHRLHMKTLALLYHHRLQEIRKMVVLKKLTLKKKIGE
jgi:hypothetical protein